MLTIRWLGVAGLEFQYQGKSLLIDPYISRPGKLATLTRPLLPDTQAIDDYLSRLDSKLAGVLVGHTHSDHVLDVPYICNKTGTYAYGTQSLSNLFGGYGMTEKALVVESGKTYKLGLFEATPIQSVHGHAILGMVPFPGEVKPGLTPPLRVNQYRHGGPLVWLVKVAGKTYMQLGSADFIDENLAGHKVDVAFVCAAGRQYTPDFSGRLVRAVSPDVIVPFHFDDFFTEIGDGPMKYVPNVNLDGFLNELAQAAPHAQIVVPKLNQVVDLG